jgi:hypothetical protein
MAITLPPSFRTPSGDETVADLDPVAISMRDKNRSARIANMAEGEAVPGCFVCGKHRDRGPLVPGGPVAEDDLVLVSHTVTPEALGRDGATAYLGHLFVEPLRHAAGLADLTDAEACRVGLWCARASRALRDVAGAEHVYAAT